MIYGYYGNYRELNNVFVSKEISKHIKGMKSIGGLTNDVVLVKSR